MMESRSVLGMRTARWGLALFAVCGLLFGALLPHAVEAAPTAAPQQGEHDGYGHFYRVKPDDSLSKIARRYSITVAALAHANGLNTDSYLYVGQRIYIPETTSHVPCVTYHYVHHGDTLIEIARHYEADYYALAMANNITNPSYIYVGQRICIPNIYADDHAGYTEMGPGMKEMGPRMNEMGPGMNEMGLGVQERGPGMNEMGSGMQEMGPGMQERGPGVNEMGSGMQETGPGMNEMGPGMGSRGDFGPGDYGYYVVKEGDTLSEIAKSYGVSSYYLAQINGIQDASHIYAGQRLKIPA